MVDGGHGVSIVNARLPVEGEMLHVRDGATIQSQKMVEKNVLVMQWKPHHVVQTLVQVSG